MSKYISVAELESEGTASRLYEAGEPTLGWDLNLPSHVDSEKLELNLSRLGALHKVGAFAASILSGYDGETSGSFLVTGINPDGSATGMAAKSTVDIHDSLFLDPERFDLSRTDKTYGHPIAIHRINRPEAVDKVIGLKEKGKTDEQAWGKVLDYALRDSFRGVGKQHLVERTNMVSRGFNYFMAGWTAYLTFPGDNIVNLGPGMVYMSAWFLNLAFDSAIHMKHRLPPLQDRRWSIFIANQFDRYVALNGLSRVPGLIRVRN
jgi:hypothetical protein